MSSLIKTLVAQLVAGISLSERRQVKCNRRTKPSNFKREEKALVLWTRPRVLTSFKRKTENTKNEGLKQC